MASQKTDPDDAMLAALLALALISIVLGGFLAKMSGQREADVAQAYACGIDDATNRPQATNVCAESRAAFHHETGP